MGDQIAAPVEPAGGIDVRWSPAEVRSIYTSAQADLLAERLAANRFCVMEARTPDLGHLGHCVVDLENGSATNHTDMRSARALADQLIAIEAVRIADEWEAER